jgi:HrpA-like RNA helicase
MMAEKEITSKLPIQAKREEILSMLDKQNILLI